MISSVEFEYGKDTCASEKGKFCRFASFIPNTFGQKYQCRLYQVHLYDELGWLKRCQQCMSEND